MDDDPEKNHRIWMRLEQHQQHDTFSTSIYLGLVSDHGNKHRTLDVH